MQRSVVFAVACCLSGFRHMLLNLMYQNGWTNYQTIHIGSLPTQFPCTKDTGKIMRPPSTMAKYTWSRKKIEIFNQYLIISWKRHKTI